MTSKIQSTLKISNLQGSGKIPYEQIAYELLPEIVHRIKIVHKVADEYYLKGNITVMEFWENQRYGGLLTTLNMLAQEC